MDNKNDKMTVWEMLFRAYPEIIKIVDSKDGVYIRIQAHCQATYGRIPSVGTIHNFLRYYDGSTKKHAHYSQRETEGSYIYRHKSGKVYRMIQVAQGRWEPEHILIAKACMGYYKGCVVHHKQEWDTLNNDPTNLEIMSRAEHTKYHQTKRLQDPEYKKNLSKKMKASWAKRKLAKRIEAINKTEAA